MSLTVLTMSDGGVEERPGRSMNREESSWSVGRDYA